MIIDHNVLKMGNDTRSKVSIKIDYSIENKMYHVILFEVL